MSRLHRAGVLVAIVLTGTVVAFPSWGQAVNVDATSLLKRLEAIEQRLSASEKRRNAAQQNMAPLQPAPSDAASPRYAVNDLERRMTELEQEVSQLNGTLEQNHFMLGQLTKKFEDMSKDFDLRVSDVETRLQKMEGAARVAAPVEPTSVVVPAATAAVPTAAAAVVASVTVPTVKSPSTPTTKTLTLQTGGGVLPEIPANMPATDMYNKGYAYLTAADYANAQRWLEEFIKRHPKNALGDNAYYWLGEVYLVQNNPNVAALRFRDGLRDYPKSPKAPAFLLKLGIALEQMKQPKLAEGAWTKLVKEHPQSPEAERAKEKLLGLKR